VHSQLTNGISSSESIPVLLRFGGDESILGSFLITIDVVSFLVTGVVDSFLITGVVVSFLAVGVVVSFLAVGVVVSFLAIGVVVVGSFLIGDIFGESVFDGVDTVFGSVLTVTGVDEGWPFIAAAFLACRKKNNLNYRCIFL
jgi:hypothetical protein